jgi:hypothetical protein
MAERNTSVPDATGRTPIGRASKGVGRHSAVATLVASAAVTFFGACYVIERAGFADLPGELTDYLAGLVLTTLIIAIASRFRGEAIDG